MKTDENKPSHGAITTAGAIQAAQDSKGLPTEDWARIIDSHTNAIADDLADALKIVSGMYERATGAPVPSQAHRALYLYTMIKIKEAK